MNSYTNLLALFLLCAHNFLIINSAETLTIYENIGLTEAEKDHTLAAALLAIEKSTDRNTIANSIVTEMTSKFGGNWNSLVTGISQSGSSLRLQSNRLIRFSYETFDIIIFQLNSTTTSTTETESSVIVAARSSSIVVQYESNTLTVTQRNTINSLITSAISSYTSYSNIEETLRKSLNTQIGGDWLVIVTATGTSFESNWSGNCVHLFRELYVGRLRIFMYQFTA